MKAMKEKVLTPVSVKMISRFLKIKQTNKQLPFTTVYFQSLPRQYHVHIKPELIWYKEIAWRRYWVQTHSVKSHYLKKKTYLPIFLGSWALAIDHFSFELFSETYLSSFFSCFPITLAWVCTRHHLYTPAHYGSEQPVTETSNLSLSHELESEWLSEQTNKCAQRSAGAKQAVRSKPISEQCKQMIDWTRQYFHPNSRLFWTIVQILYTMYIVHHSLYTSVFVNATPSKSFKEIDKGQRSSCFFTAVCPRLAPTVFSAVSGTFSTLFRQFFLGAPFYRRHIIREPFLHIFTQTGEKIYSST